jgi:inosine triphosphate pyrophosphatase
MLAGFEDKSAYAMTIYGYLESEKDEPILFIGKTDGKIVVPRGEARFGWDPNFEENSTGLT